MCWSNLSDLIFQILFFMKKFLLFCFVLFPVLSFSQALSGNYLIGTNQPFPFNKLTTAVARVNSNGVSGPVTFLLDDVTYSNATGEVFPIKVMQFTGTSATNTLTIRPNVGMNVTISAANSNGYTGVPAVIQLDGADNITIDGSNSENGTGKNLTIENNDDIFYIHRSVIWISSNSSKGADKIIVKNTNIKTGVRNSSYANLIGIFVGNNTVGGNNSIGANDATAVHSNLSFTNNQYLNVRQGIIVKGGSTSSLRATNIIVSKNTFGSTIDSQKPSLAVSLLNTDISTVTDNTMSGLLNNDSSDPNLSAIKIDNSSNAIIRGNIINNIKTTGAYSCSIIWIKGSSAGAKISENKISNGRNLNGGTLYGIHVDISAPTSGTSITNNFISDITSSGTSNQTSFGIYIANGNGANIFHNSVALNTAQPGQSAAIVFAGGTGFDVRNNIFVNTKTAGTRFAIYSVVPSSAFTNINYNNYVSSVIGHLGSVRSSLADWQTATTKDQNSVSIIPNFSSISDLHLTASTNGSLDNLGQPLTQVQTDIDFQPRSTTNPDIGADEFSAPIPLASQPTSQSTNLIFTNVTADSFKINWTNGPGTNRIVVIRSGSAINSAPIDTNSYTSNPIFGQGAQLGTGNYVVYNGNANTVTVTGLSGSTTYFASIYEYNGTGTASNYLTILPLSGNIITLNDTLGWQILNTNTLNTITFDATVAGVNNSAFTGNGIATSPTAGQLNSNAWSVLGLEGGSIAFGGINTNSTFGLGQSNGNSTEGGIYAFQTSPNNSALGIQSTSSNFAPGEVSLRIQNQTGAPITSISFGYKVYIYNDTPGSNSVTFSHSSNNSVFTEIPQITTTSPSASEAAPSWKSNYRVATITGLSIPANSFYYVKWQGSTDNVSTTYDAFAIDDIVLSANPTTNFVAVDGIADTFVMHGNAQLSGNLTIVDATTFSNGKLAIKNNTLTLGGTITNTVVGALTGGSTSNVSVVGNGDKTLSFDQTTIGTTNLLNNLTIPLAAGVSKSVTLSNPLLINGTLNVGLDQTLNLGTNVLRGDLNLITINGNLRTQNTSALPFPTGKTFSGNGTVFYDAAVAQTFVSGTYNNVTLSSVAGTRATANVTVNGILDLPSANPSATLGSLSMQNNSVLTMGPLGTNTGVGDVTGVISRETFVPNVLYTFGHKYSSILFPNIGTLPQWMKVKVIIGENNWRSGAIKRYYDITQFGAQNTKAIIREHYLDSELNGNIESKLVNWGYYSIAGTFFEQGRSNINTDENWVEITNANLGLFFQSTFDKVYITLDQTEAAVLTWNGELSNSWTTVGNWTENDGTKTSIPSLDTKVIIPNVNSLVHIPVLNPMTQVQSIEIEQGGIINSTPDAIFEIYGTSGAWLNNGQFNAPTGAGKVIFKNLDATISGTTTFNNIEVASGASLRTLDGNTMIIGGTFTNNGIIFAGLNPNSIKYSGSNQLVINPNGTSFESYYNLIISGTNATFPSSLNIRGDLILNSPVSFTNKTIGLIGDADQKLKGTAAINLNNLIVNKVSGDVVLERDITVNGTLTLNSGRLVIGSNNLTLGTNAVDGGPFNVNTMIVADGTGFVRRPYTAVGSFFFPIGDTTSSLAYSPISVNITEGSFANGIVSVSLVDDIHPNNNSTQNYISRYWKVSQTGITNAVATVNANYIAAEVLVAENTMSTAQLVGSFDQQNNPWIRFAPLNNLTLSAVGALLPPGEISYFTGIKGGSISTTLSGGGNYCNNEPITLTAQTQGGDLPYTYSWSNNLGTEVSATPLVSNVGTNTYTVIVKDANGIEVSNSVTVTSSAAIIAGTLSADQLVCFASQPGAITLNGNSADVLYWQKSSDVNFSSSTTITNTTTTLGSLEAGQILGETYFRAAVSNGLCDVVFTDPIKIDTKTTEWNGNLWSNGFPDSSTSVVISGNLSVQSTLYACSITVINNAEVIVPAGIDVIINGALIVNSGSFYLSSNSNLVQIKNEVNFGNITVARESAPLFRLDYTMWGSPVLGSQTLLNFSPATLTNRFYTYNSATNNFEGIAPATNTFETAKGYLIRMPNTHIVYGAQVNPLSWTGSFVGVPHNGDVNIGLNTSGDGYNMVANPYASMIDADTFLENNQNEIEGTLYFWRRRNNSINQTELTSAFYATYTAAGGTGVDPVATASSSSEIPNGFIQVGQGFLVKAAATPLNGELIFNNTMRTVANSEDQFFRNANIERSRIWLNVTTSTGAFGQMLIAYMPTAVNSVDRTDGKYISDGTMALTSWLDNTEYIIQGRAPFQTSDVVALHFKTPTSGNYSIAIDHVDGLFLGNQNIYLRDNVLGITHNLKQAAYTFASESGTFNSRFEILYESATLSVQQTDFTANSVVLYKAESNIVINAGTTILEYVEVFDIRGRLLATVKKINASEVSINVGNVNQVLIVKITSIDGITVSKKTVN